MMVTAWFLLLVSFSPPNYYYAHAQQQQEQQLTRKTNCVPALTAPPLTGTTVLGHEPGIYIASSNLPLNWPLDEIDRTRLNIISECAWDDARVLGGNVIIPWSKFDYGPQQTDSRPRYNLSWVEEQISLWADNRDKKVNLLVWSSAQQTKQQFGNGGESMTPQWLFDLGVPTVRCNDNNDNKGDSPVLPVHNDVVVRQKFQEALSFIYNHYKDDNRINYFRFGAGVGSENYPINSGVNPNGPCRKVWEEKGGGNVNDWIEHLRTMIDFFGQLQNEGQFLATDIDDYVDNRPESAKDNKPIVVSLNDYKSLQEVRQGNSHRAVDAIFNAARQHRLGIGCQGPTDRRRRQYQRGERESCFWCTIFDQAKRDPRIPIIEIQTPNNSGPRGCTKCGDGEGPGYSQTGPLQTLGPFLLERGVTSFELYPFEFRVANLEQPFGGELNEEFGDMYDTTLNTIAVGAVRNAQQKAELDGSNNNNNDQKPGSGADNAVVGAEEPSMPGEPSGDISYHDAIDKDHDDDYGSSSNNNLIPLPDFGGSILPQHQQHEEQQQPPKLPSSSPQGTTKDPANNLSAAAADIEPTRPSAVEPSATGTNIMDYSASTAAASAINASPTMNDSPSNNEPTVGGNNNADDLLLSSPHDSTDAEESESDVLQAMTPPPPFDDTDTPDSTSTASSTTSSSSVATSYNCCGKFASVMISLALMLLIPYHQ